jgi:hypothetical protein
MKKAERPKMRFIVVSEPNVGLAGFWRAGFNVGVGVEVEVQVGVERIWKVMDVVVSGATSSWCKWFGLEVGKEITLGWEIHAGKSCLS